MKITALIPTRAGSQRVKNKNIRKFVDSSLIEIKLQQLRESKKIDEIVVSTDDEKVKEICRSVNDERVKIQDREKYFASNACHTDELIKYITEAIDFECLLWTHVTSPFITAEIYDRAIENYLDKLKDGYDSLISVQKCQEYIWNLQRNAVNYDKQNDGVWPKTQNIEPLFIINSGIFIASKEVMKKNKNRIGEKPFYFPTNAVEGFDIDWEEDFRLAEKMWTALDKVSFK